ncbi:MAG: GNAT family N-acetyltransferase [Calditrichia bacterium]|nr:GNAT family N-acetyltransferase [Calditrichia bacterium]
MQSINRIEIVQLLPNTLRNQAAKLLYESFYIKMRVLIKEKDKALRLIRAATNYESGFYVILDNKLVGITGIQNKGNKYFNVKFSDLLKEFSFFTALPKFIRFKLESISFPKDNELEIVALSVQKDMRGKNIGTSIINEIIKYAKEKEFNRLSLTVVDTNQDAKKLYERIGFSITKIVKYGFITRSAGFEAVIHMYKNI